MKSILLITFIVLAPLLSRAQAKGADGGFGFAINSSMNGEVYPIRLAPSVTYLSNFLAQPLD